MEFTEEAVEGIMFVFGVAARTILAQRMHAARPGLRRQPLPRDHTTIGRFSVAGTFGVLLSADCADWEVKIEGLMDCGREHFSLL